MKDILGGILVFLSFSGFILIENVFTIQPSVTSGNGNLGLLVIICLSPIFIGSYLYTFKRTRELISKEQNKMISILVISFSLLLGGFMVFLIINYRSDLIVALGGTPSNPDSRIFRYGWLNQYTNSIYFNAYTFILTHSLAFAIGIISMLTSKSINQ
ncbi:hypothetical protein [Planococcus soli]|uniref:hypothetical protein n=1 Tax=Planococcus soli TaxID=2666072 RepID=UPI001F1B7440|nr:hypothetical protein [Planococcus soli]